MALWQQRGGAAVLQVIGAPTLFATHFHELTGLKSDVGVANLHVETAIDQDSGKLTMLYQVTSSRPRRTQCTSNSKSCWRRMPSILQTHDSSAPAHSFANAEASMRARCRVQGKT